MFLLLFITQMVPKSGVLCDGNDKVKMGIVLKFFSLTIFKSVVLNRKFEAFRSTLVLLPTLVLLFIGNRRVVEEEHEPRGNV